MEADPGLHQWYNALNEFLLESDGKLDLGTILTKATALHSKIYKEEPARTEDESTSQEDDNETTSEEEEYDHQLGWQEDKEVDEMVEKTKNFGLEVARRKREWKAREDQMRAEAVSKGNVGNGQFYQHKQVFTSAAASGILANDLVAIMGSQEETGIKADTVEDNIFQWNVKMSDFADSPQLQQDLEQLGAEFGYKYIELQLDFSMDLYPFFPPQVKVLRPRLQGSMMLRVPTLEILKLSHWDPARDMRSVLTEIKAFLSTWARIDLASEKNDCGKHPEGAYIKIEHHLLQLAMMSEVTPRGDLRHHDQRPNKMCAITAKPTSPPASGTESHGACNSSGSKSSNSSSSTSKKAPHPKGTGYSSHGHKGWDVRVHQAAQKEKDSQIQMVLKMICSELKRSRDGDTADSVSDLHAVVEGSALLPFLETKLQVGH